MKIAVDAFGGDNAPYEIVKGAVDAIRASEGFEVVLVGKEEPIKKLLDEFDCHERVEIVDAPDVIGCDEAPVMAIRRKKQSSIVKMFNLLSSGEVDACMSAGSSGAVLAGGIFLCHRLEGVDRPAFSAVLPTVKGGAVVLADSGANTDCKPEWLLQFAFMADAYARCMLGAQDVRIGLLSNGAEDEKGNELTKAAHALLKESDLHFVGNCEARDILSGDYDVIVCDGFDGNVALKSAEGTAQAVFGMLKEGIDSSFRAKLGALLLKPVLKGIARKMDYSNYGGAALLGVAKPVVKVHGSAKAKSVKAAVLQCVKMVESDTVGKVAEYLEK